MAHQQVDLRLHGVAVHAEKRDGQGVGEEFLLDFDGILDDGEDALFARFVHQVLEHETGEVAVEAFIAGDQLVAERQSCVGDKTEWK